MIQDLLPWAVWLIELAIVAFTLNAAGIVLQRHGEARWAVWVPVYNLFALTRAARSHGLAWIGLLIPFLNVVVWLFVSVSLAERCERSKGFGLGLALLPFVFYPLLAFRKERAA